MSGLPSIFMSSSREGRSKAPWRHDVYKGARAETTHGVKFGWKLFHYLAGGGIKIFGRTLAQEEADWKRTRFLIGVTIFFLMWLFFWI